MPAPIHAADVIPSEYGYAQVVPKAAPARPAPDPRSDDLAEPDVLKLLGIDADQLRELRALTFPNPTHQRTEHPAKQLWRRLQSEISAVTNSDRSTTTRISTGSKMVDVYSREKVSAWLHTIDMIRARPHVRD